MDEWQDKLAAVGYLEHQPEVIVSQLNLSDILRVLDLTEVVTFEEALSMLAYYRNCEALFSEFARDFVRCIEKNSAEQEDHIMAEEESAEIKILRFLERLRESQISVVGIDPSQIERELNYAINKT